MLSTYFLVVVVLQQLVTCDVGIPLHIVPDSTGIKGVEDGTIHSLIDYPQHFADMNVAVKLG